MFIDDKETTPKAADLEGVPSSSRLAILAPLNNNDVSGRELDFGEEHISVIDSSALQLYRGALKIMIF